MRVRGEREGCWIGNCRLEGSSAKAREAVVIQIGVTDPCYYCRVKKHVLISLVFIVCPILFAQGDPPLTLPSDPNALLEMATPFYDYASPDMKPWHVRYHYQYYDENGLPVVEGEFDFWWSTTKVSRVSWTHGNQSHIEWHTADGRELRSVAGNDIASMEHRLYSALLPGFLKMKDSPSVGRQLKNFTTQYSSQQVVCIGSVKQSATDTKIDSLDSVWPAYCFTEHEPVLIASHENGSITNSYGQVQKFQNHNFASQIEISYVGKKKVEARLEDLSEVHADDAAFTPSTDAKEYVAQTSITISPNITKSSLALIKKVDPVYPLGARAAHITGTVVVIATIGKDGRIKGTNVISSPDASLTAAALDAVREWRYEPYTVNGQPVEVNTLIHIGFTL